VLEEPIRTIGEHAVAVHLVGRLRPRVTVIVHGEADEESAAAETTATGEGGEPALEDEA
jgi:hypothetical protein